MKFKIFPVAIVMIMMLNGCASKAFTAETNSSEYAAEASYVNKEEMFSDRDYEVGYDETNSVLINLNGDAAECDSKSVNISDGRITISEEGVYVVSGTLNDGMIIVNADKADKIHIVLNNASITSKTSAPIYVLQADKVFITLAADTDNSLSNGGSFEAIDENNIDAVIFSKQDLTLNGSGNLKISSPAGGGIVAKDDLVFTGGYYTVNSASDAIDANDSIRIANSSMTISSEKDGIHAENSDDSSLGYIYIDSGSFNISSANDGISAGAYLQIENGSFDITSGGGSVNAEVKNNKLIGGFHQMGARRFSDLNNTDSNNIAPNNANPNNTEIQQNTELKEFSADENSRFGARPSNGNTHMNRNNAELPADRFGEGTMPPNGNIQSNGDIQSNSNIQPNDNMKPMKEFQMNNEVNATEQESVSKKGIKAQSGILIENGSFNINSADDSIHSNTSVNVKGGIFDIASGDDGFHADDELSVASGTINITESYEALEGLKINILGGEINLKASDDGINAAGGRDLSGADDFANSDKGSINIENGNIYINASGDGIDANGTLNISGGTITVSGPTQGDTSVLDYDESANITGGTFIGTGAVQMAQTFSSSQQGIITLTTGNQTAGTEITLTDSAGNVVISYTPDQDFGFVILSSPNMTKGEEYTVTVGSLSNKFTAA